MRSWTIAFLLGVVCVQHLVTLPTAWWLLLGMVLLPALLWLPAWRIILAVPSGFLWALAYAHWVMSALPQPHQFNHDWVVEGEVITIPTQTERSTRFEFRITTIIRGANDASRLPMKVALSWYQQRQPIRVGERWQLLVRLKQPHGLRNPGGSDYESRLFRKRIVARGYVKSGEPTRRLSQAPISLHQLRQTIGDSLVQLMPESEFKSMILALALGDRTRMTPEQWQVLRKTGTAHLVAISGLHVGMIATTAFFLCVCVCRLFRTTIPRSQIAAAGALIAAVAYSALAGFSLPTVRALLMLCLLMIAMGLRRVVLAEQVIAVAALVMVMFDPLMVLDAGYWLSFGAVLIILFLSRSYSGHLSFGFKWLVMPGKITIGMMPLSVLMFSEASLVSPLANLVAIPVVGFLLVPLVVLATALTGLAPQWGSVVLNAVDRIFQVLWSGLQWLSEWPLVTWTPAPLSWETSLLLCVGIGLLLVGRGLPGRGLAIILMLPAIWPVHARPAVAEFWVDMLDVGQGLAVVVRTQKHVLVYDAGPQFEGGFDAGIDVVAPFLNSVGLQSIDSLMVSHADNDHIGGVEKLRQAFPVQRILTSAHDQIIGSESCSSGQQWQWDKVSFTVLSPQPGERVEGNDASCVLLVQSEYGRLLLTGDIETRTEGRLLQRYREKLAADIVLVPHHGSRTSSTPGFVYAASPQYALLSSGYRNRFNHPHNDVVQRYRSLGIKVLNTAYLGAVQLRIDELGVSAPLSWREQQRRYWHHR